MEVGRGNEGKVEGREGKGREVSYLSVIVLFNAVDIIFRFLYLMF